MEVRVIRAGRLRVTIEGVTPLVMPYDEYEVPGACCRFAWCVGNEFTLMVKAAREALSTTRPDEE